MCLWVCIQIYMCRMKLRCDCIRSSLMIWHPKAILFKYQHIVSNIGDHIDKNYASLYIQNKKFIKIPG